MKTLKLIERITIFSLLITSTYAAEEYGNDEFKRDLLSPLHYSQDILLTGSLITTALIATRESTIIPFQESVSEQEPLGDLAPVGDIMGQLVPNLAYMGYQSWRWK